jgi:hypothetical protein
MQNRTNARSVYVEQQLTSAVAAVLGSALSSCSSPGTHSGSSLYTSDRNRSATSLRACPLLLVSATASGPAQKCLAAAAACARSSVVIAVVLVLVAAAVLLVAVAVVAAVVSRSTWSSITPLSSCISSCIAWLATLLSSPTACSSCVTTPGRNCSRLRAPT